MDLERERGITIKSQAVRTVYHGQGWRGVYLQPRSTPRVMWTLTMRFPDSLAACDGAILVVDAAQGIEAQTLANVYLALDHDLDVFPVINKIDLPSADPERGHRRDRGCHRHLKLRTPPGFPRRPGLNVDQVLEAIVHRIPAPEAEIRRQPLKALIFDSLYDSLPRRYRFRAVIMDGTVKKGTPIHMMATGLYGGSGGGRLLRRRPVHPLRRAQCRHGRLHHRLPQERQGHPRGRYGDETASNPCAARFRAIRRSTRWFTAVLYPADGAKYHGSSGRPGEAAAQRCFPAVLSRRPPSLWASVSAAVS